MPRAAFEESDELRTVGLLRRFVNLNVVNVVEFYQFGFKGLRIFNARCTFSPSFFFLPRVTFARYKTRAPLCCKPHTCFRYATKFARKGRARR